MPRGSRRQKRQSEMALVTPSNQPETIEPRFENSILQCFQSPEFARSIITALQPVLDEIKKDINENRNLINDQKIKIEEQEKKINDLQKKLQDQQKKITTCEVKSGQWEKDKRQNVLRVVGLDYGKKGDEDFVKIIKEKMNINLNANDYIIGDVGVNKATQSRPNDQENNKNVKLITFYNIWKKRELYYQRSTLKGTNIYMNEELNKEEQGIFYQCRKMKKEGMIAATWTKNLNIICKNNENEFITISTYEQLKEFEEKINRKNSPPATVHI